MSDSNGLLTPRERHDYGVIAMLESEDGIRVECREYHGMIKPALRELADYCDREGLLVTCVSTPNTILADVRGRQPDRQVNTRRVRNMQPEVILLGQIRRIDIVHPRLRSRP